MAVFSQRDLFYALLIISAVWFLLLFIQLENCKDGLTSSPGNHHVKRLRDLLKSKDTEINYLRSKLNLHLQNYVPGIPVIYIITPTYTRPVQKAELTRLATVFKSVPNVHWIVVEDSTEKTALVKNFLTNSKLNHTHLLSITPERVKLKAKDPNWLKPRGVLQRNTGLSWLREHLNPDSNNGVVYFADDDNTYTTEIFEEMRDTKMVSVWPVGLVGKLRYEAPIIKERKVVDWHTYWYRGKRPFAMDMAGFAVNLKLILGNKNAEFSIDAHRGYQESAFLESLGVKLEHLEPKASMCTKVLVWHTRTEPANISNEEKMLKLNLEQSDPDVEV